MLGRGWWVDVYSVVKRSVAGSTGWSAASLFFFFALNANTAM